MPEGRARFSPLDLPSAASAKEGLPATDSHFYLATRRGSQFNSMIFDSVDPLTGTRREDVLLSPEDAARLGIAAGDRIRLRSATGEFIGRARLGEVAHGCLVAVWPEANVLIPRRYDAGSGEPDYHAEVTVEKVGS